MWQNKKNTVGGRSILKKTQRLERKMEDPGGAGFLLFIGSQAFRSFASPSLCLFLSGGKYGELPVL